MYSEVLSKMLVSYVEGLRSGFSGGYRLEEVVLIFDGNCNDGSCEYSV